MRKKRDTVLLALLSHLYNLSQYNEHLGTVRITTRFDKIRNQLYQRTIQRNSLCYTHFFPLLQKDTLMKRKLCVNIDSEIVGHLSHYMKIIITAVLYFLLREGIEYFKSLPSFCSVITNWSWVKQISAIFASISAMCSSDKIGVLLQTHASENMFCTSRNWRYPRTKG